MIIASHFPGDVDPVIGVLEALRAVRKTFLFFYKVEGDPLLRPFSEGLLLRTATPFRKLFSSEEGEVPELPAVTLLRQRFLGRSVFLAAARQTCFPRAGQPLSKRLWGIAEFLPWRKVFGSLFFLTDWRTPL